MGILDKMQTPKELRGKQGRAILITGKSGSGKTHLIGSSTELYPKFEDGRNQVLIIDSMSGNSTLGYREDVDILSNASFNDVQQLFKELRRGDHHYKVIAFDVISAFYLVILDHVMHVQGAIQGKLGIPTQQGYLLANNHLFSIVKHFRTLCVEQGVHVIFATHTKEEIDSLGNFKVRPNLTATRLDPIIGLTDLMGTLVAKESKRNEAKRILKLIETTDRFK